MSSPTAFRAIETIDHVTIAGADLAALQQAFAEVGLASEYGGPHSSGATHMAQLGFDDGSYIELISLLDAAQTSSLWHEAIVGNAGPCAWAVDPGDVASEAQRISAAGIAVQGPTPLNRTRPDGRLVEWDLAFLGEGQPGNTLPFIIHDRTPRDWRVQPSASVSGNELTGIAMVVLGAPELTSASNLFQAVYGWSDVATQDDSAFGATLTHFPGTPMTLATPSPSISSNTSWLTQRLHHFGPLPCAFLIGTSNMAASVKRFPLSEPYTWFGRELRWFDTPALRALHLGLISQ